MIVEFHEHSNTTHYNLGISKAPGTQLGTSKELGLGTRLTNVEDNLRNLRRFYTNHDTRLN